MRYFLLMCIFVLACGSARPVQPFDATQDRPAPTVPESYQITYEIEGTAFTKAKLTYQNATGSSQQEEIEIPWSTTFSAPAGQFVYLSGQLANKGTIRCRILVDGQPFKEAESKGEYVIASCSGSVPR